MASDANSAHTTGNTTPEVLLNSMSNSKNIFNTFTQQVTLKLDENNFHSWKQQIEGIIRTHKLRRFLVNPDVPLRYLVDEGRTNDTENHAFDMWEQHDLLLFTWLLTTIFGMRCTSTSLHTQTLSIDSCGLSWSQFRKVINLLLLILLAFSV